MKELSLEEKAIAYDEALTLMQDCIPDEDGLVHVRPEEIFHELKDSGCERIRKNLITFFKNTYGTNSGARFAGIKVKDILSWLERQGSQILANSAKTCKDEQKPQNWTKEDKERYISCLQRLSTGNPEQPETINSKWFKEHVYPQNR